MIHFPWIFRHLHDVNSRTAIYLTRFCKKFTSAAQTSATSSCHMKRVCSSLFLLPCVLVLIRSNTATAQLSSTGSQKQSASQNQKVTTEKNFVKHIAFDQLHIWESPFKLRGSDATWAVPFGILTGSLVKSDHDLSKQLAKPSRLDTSKRISDVGLYTFIGSGAGFYGIGVLTNDDHKRETGLLAGEAAVNATVVAEVLKVAFGRQRPFEGDHFGHIGKGGDSFPSEHAIDSWAIASVVAHEYPNPIVQLGAYGLASAVSAARVTAGQHFPSDVLVGGVFGYLIGRKVYNDHHNPELGGAEYGTFSHEQKHDAAHAGSAYVPLDSWVYPVIDRLSAMGLIRSNFDSERPWTRLECERLVREAQRNTADLGAASDAAGLIDALAQEFQSESVVVEGGSNNRSADLESVYTRMTEISGTPLRDSYHFGQTLVNDYGRPYGKGFNDVSGFSARATSGPLVLYFRGEYQRSPANAKYTTAQGDQLNSADYGTPAISDPFPAENRFRVLDAYIGVNFGNYQLTLGQQSLWWGPGTGGALMFTNNAEPIKMIRLSRVSPLEIPWISRILGPLRSEVFVGQMDGHHYIFTQGVLHGPILATQPYLQGQRFSFKPTPNFEFGFARTGIFSGTGIPLTTRSFLRATFGGTSLPGSATDPGDRRSGVDITYRMPKLRDWLTFYVDAFADDEVSPLFAPRRSAMHPGIYLPKLPKLPKVDLRVEGVYTDPPNFGFQGFFYANVEYRNGYTIDGNLIGNWIGREGRGVYSKSTVWISPRNSIELSFRDATVDREFLQGGSYRDGGIKADFAFKRSFTVSSMVQFESWRFPLLASTGKRNLVTSLQLTYWPSHWHKN